MATRRRYRTVISAVGLTAVSAAVGEDTLGHLPPLKGRIRRVRATADSATDPDADPGQDAQGNSATDIAVQVLEGNSSAGIDYDGVVPLAYSLASEAGGAAVASLDLDSEEDIWYELPPGQALLVSARVDLAASATVVVLLEIELDVD